MTFDETNISTWKRRQKTEESQTIEKHVRKFIRDFN